jgi:hypothetical protein
MYMNKQDVNYCKYKIQTIRQTNITDSQYDVSDLIVILLLLF